MNQNPNPPSDDRPIKKKVDEDWKRKAQTEKAAASGEPAPPVGAEKAGSSAPSGSPALSERQRVEGSAPSAQAGPPSKAFLNLVSTLGSQAVMQLGMEPNPYTGRAEIDIEGARFVIDTLEMLKAKTAGNLTADENKALEGVLHELQLAYVEAARAVQQAMLKRNPPPGGGKQGPLSNR